MPAVDVPLLGTLVICATLVLSAYTFAVAVAAGRGRSNMLSSARWGTYATCLMIAFGICLLAYAFQTHDFRIRYVARYSDRSMHWVYLLTSLWGGQDGSLLWWSFLLGGWTAVCNWSMKGRYLELQPWVLATLMSIIFFFQLLMLWAANPFATLPAATPIDGEGLNPLLQNYWMVIHPPTLYMGFVGWAIPFAFCIAALMTGRLHDEWLVAIRRWVLAAWLFLSVGLVLGMVWSYEELGWGGYWAWDPVENASFMPWLVATAFLHSTIIQERYGMLKVWNVFLMCLTFFMTIFGTFLTRSGLIASVHSFARSDIGIYFVVYMHFIVIVSISLILWRYDKLVAVHRIKSLLSREFAFLLNNWILLAMMVFVLVATTYPLISEWSGQGEATVGPPFYNRWMVPFGIVLLLLAGVGPLISWRKATGKHLLRAFAWPAVVGVIVALMHVFLGDAMGFPFYIESPEIYTNKTTGAVLQFFYGIGPTASLSASAFVVTTVVQEFWRGTSVRMRTKGENPLVALFYLTWRANRRYGGYVVHVAIVVMYIGFTGAAYDVETESALQPGQRMEVGDYEVRYDGARTEEDANKHSLIADMTIFDEDGDEVATVEPAKFIYRTHPDMPTTEVAIEIGVVEDIYVIMSTVDPQSRLGTFRVIVRPGVLWIWIGALLMILGTFIAVAPSTNEFARWMARGSKAGAVILLLGLGLAFAPTAEAQSSSLHAGTVVIEDPQERMLFERLLCMCGDCQRLTLANCGCSWAEDARADLRQRMSNGASPEELQAVFVAEHGQAAISIPSDEGLGRALWAVPLGLGVLAIGFVAWTGSRWRKRETSAAAAEATQSEDDDEDDDYDARLDEELAELGGDD